MIMWRRLWIAALAGVAAANAVPMTPAERRTWGELQLALCKAEIGDTDVAAFVDGLRARHRDVVVMAIANVVAHRRADLTPRLKDIEIGRRDYCAAVARVAEASLRAATNDASTAFCAAAREEAGSDAKRRALTTVAVRLQVRDLRLGKRKTVDLDGPKPTDYEQLLVEYAKLSDAEAIRGLVAKMEGLAAIREPWSSVLASYGEDGCRAAIERLNKDVPASIYGTIALLATLSEAAIWASPSTRADVAAVAARAVKSKEPRIRTAAEAVARAVEEAAVLDKAER